MNIRYLYILLALFLVSCSNYNHIRFVNSGDFKVADKVVEESNDEELEVPIETPPCDMVYFKNGEIKTYRVLRIGAKYVDVLHCKHEAKYTRKIADIDSIKYSNGLLWPETNQLCDTIEFYDGSKIRGKITAINTQGIKIDNCTDYSSDHNGSLLKLNEIRSVKYSYGYEWSPQELIRLTIEKKEQQQQYRQNDKSANKSRRRIKAIWTLIPLGITLLATGIITIFGTYYPGLGYIVMAVGVLLLILGIVILIIHLIKEKRDN